MKCDVSCVTLNEVWCCQPWIYSEQFFFMFFVSCVTDKNAFSEVLLSKTVCAISRTKLCLCFSLKLYWVKLNFCCQKLHTQIAFSEFVLTENFLCVNSVYTLNKQRRSPATSGKHKTPKKKKNKSAEIANTASSPPCCNIFSETDAYAFLWIYSDENWFFLLPKLHTQNNWGIWDSNQRSASASPTHVISRVLRGNWLKKHNIASWHIQQFSVSVVLCRVFFCQK